MNGAQKTVLVVEDDQDIASLIQDVLEEAGHRVLLATDGNKAMVLARSATPDVISLDLMLPHKSGHDILAELDADPQLRHIPVVVASAFGGQLVPTPQVRAVIPKPFDLDALLRALTSAGETT